MFQDFLNDITSLKSEDLHISLEITPQEAAQGTSCLIALSSNMPCSLCQGQGVLPGTFRPKPCRPCSGQGIVPCQKDFQVVLPAGIHSGETVTIHGKGLYTLFAQSRGDLYVQVNVMPGAPVPVQHQPHAAPFLPPVAAQPTFLHNAPTVAHQPTSLPRIAPFQFGNYRLLQQLGEGGFAEVHLGEHCYLKTHAAIKILKEQMSQQVLASFIEEARTIATLKHPHIVRVLEFGVEGQAAFLVMDYAPNGTLRKLHPRGTTLLPRTILSYVKQVARALQYAHDRNIVHRDVKPENMLVDADNTILLSDFGIALQVSQHTRSMARQEAIGTVSYMAPEQIQGKPRPASDQYALSVIVYEWLCGECPFRGADDMAIAMQHLMTSPPSLRSRIPTISPAIEQVVMRALAKDPHQRFDSVQEFATALERAI